MNDGTRLKSTADVGAFPKSNLASKEASFSERGLSFDVLELRKGNIPDQRL